LFSLKLIPIDDARRILKKRGWNIGDRALKFGAKWVVFCHREGDALRAQGRTQTEAWCNAVSLVIASEN